MIRFEQHGDFKRTLKLLEKISTGAFDRIVLHWANKGLTALRSNTPKDSGITAADWDFKIERTRDGLRIGYYNGNSNNGYNIAVLLIYGHGTKTGGWVERRDFITPVARPMFDNMAKAIWREVTDT